MNKSRQISFLIRLVGFSRTSTDPLDATGFYEQRPVKCQTESADESARIRLWDESCRGGTQPSLFIVRARSENQLRARAAPARFGNCARQMLSPEQLCPSCGKENACRVANGCAYKGPCWCEAYVVPAEVQRQLAEAHPGRACLCRECLVRFSKSSAALTREESTAANPIEREDYYLDEFGRMVFTAAYHLKRGHCCDSGCRHCPYPPPETFS